MIPLNSFLEGLALTILSFSIIFFLLKLRVNDLKKNIDEHLVFKIIGRDYSCLIDPLQKINIISKLSYINFIINLL